MRLCWAGHVVRMEERKNAHRILFGKLLAEQPLVRPRRRWVSNIKVGLKEAGCEYGR